MYTRQNPPEEAWKTPERIESHEVSLTVKEANGPVQAMKAIKTAFPPELRSVWPVERWFTMKERKLVMKTANTIRETSENIEIREKNLQV